MITKGITIGFLECFYELKSEGVLSDSSLREYWNYNVHSYLQYCLIMGAHHEGFRGTPEHKLRLSKPIDKYHIDPRLRNRKTRYMRTIRVDVGFLKGGKLIGIGEIYTPDEIHGCLPSKKLDGAWVTPYDKLVHIARYEEDIKFIILIIGLWTLPPWKDARKKTLQEWHEYWERLVEQISNKKHLVAVYIEELNKVTTPQ